MRLHHLIFIGLAAWAGMMTYRAHRIIAPLVPDNIDDIHDINGGSALDLSGNRYRSKKASDSRQFSDDSDTGAIGGIGNAGKGFGGFMGLNDRGYSSNMRPSQDARTTSNFLNAAANGDIDGLKEMLDRHVMINSRDTTKRTALMYAAWNGKKEACALLLSSGASVRAKDAGGYNAIDYAAGRGHVETVQWLIERADMNDDRHYVEYAGLMRAAYAGDKNLMPPGALSTVNRISAEDQSPLMVAAGNGSLAVMDALVSRGADTNIENAEKQTPLHWAAWNNQTQAVSWLLAHGANKKMTDKNGDTALSMARQKNYDGVIALLR